MTYREMWDIYIEPNLEAQKRLERKLSNVPEEPDRPLTVDEKVAECQGLALMMQSMGIQTPDLLEVGKAARKSWPLKPDDYEKLKEKLLARSRNQT